jgi:ectoine hydroxylase-related dioxygenase (phytanoyl-CoA dioxygenase family)
MVGGRYEVEGVPVDVVELTGSPGDVVVTHLHVFHSASPNTAAEPRQMLAKAVLAA